MRESLFIRLLTDEYKNSALTESLAAVREGNALEGVLYAVDPVSFKQIPGAPFAYWVSEGIRRIFTQLPKLLGKDRDIRIGLSTSDDFRFLRTWWEVSPQRVLAGANSPKGYTDLEPFQAFCLDRTHKGKRWVHFAKGGVYSPFYADLHLVINWENDGGEIKSWVVSNPADPGTTHWSRRVANSEYYFRPGLTWRGPLGQTIRPVRAVSFSLQVKQG